MKTSVLKICQESFFDDLTNVKIYKKKTKSLESYMTDIPNSLQEKQVTTPIGRFSTPDNIGTELSENEGRVVEYQQDIEELNNLRSMLLENQNEGLNENKAEDVISRIELITKNVDEDVRIPSLEQFTDVHTKIPAIKITLEGINELIPLLESNINKRKELIYDNILHLSQEGFFDKIKGLFSKKKIDIKNKEGEIKKLNPIIEKLKTITTEPQNKIIEDKSLINNLGSFISVKEILNSLDVEIELEEEFNHEANYCMFEDFFMDLDKGRLNNKKDFYDEVNSTGKCFIEDLITYKNSKKEKNGYILGPFVGNIYFQANFENNLPIFQFNQLQDKYKHQLNILTTNEIEELYNKISLLLVETKKFKEYEGINNVKEGINWLDLVIKMGSIDREKEYGFISTDEDLIKAKEIMLDTTKLFTLAAERLDEINLKSIDLLMEYINLSLKEYGIDTKLELSKEDFFDKLNKDILPKNIGLESFVC